MATKEKSYNIKVPVFTTTMQDDIVLFYSQQKR